MNKEPGFLEPVYNEKNELCWLSVTYKKNSTTPPDKPIDAVIKEDKTLIDVPVFTLKQQGSWFCLKCGATIHSPDGPPRICDESQGGCNRPSQFKPLTETINPDLWKIPHWKDIDIDKKQLYEDLLTLIKKLVVFSDDIEYQIYTLWIISTWKLESWDSVGFPVFIGIPDSGKSQALIVIHHLGYRSPKASGVKVAAIPRLCHYHNVTLLIDECHNKLNPKTEKGSDLIDFCKDSYKRGSVYITCDNNDQKKTIITRNFGFKAFAGEKTFNAALLTRGFIFWMEKATPEIAKLSYVEQELNDLQTRLLNYRIKTNHPPDLGNDFILKGRTREIFESIIATAMHIGIPTAQLIEYAKDKDRKEEEALKQTSHYEILAIIKDFEDNPYKIQQPDRIGLDEITRELGWEDNIDSKKKLGWSIKNLGLMTKKIDKQRYIFFEEADNAKRLKQLYKRFKLNNDQTKLMAGTL